VISQKFIACCGCLYDLWSEGIDEPIEVFPVDLAPRICRDALALDFAYYAAIPEPEVVSGQALEVAELDLKSRIEKPPRSVDL